MWIFSKDGALSVVEHRDNPELLMVRGRDYVDVLTWARQCKISAELVEETPEADYGFRFVVERRRFAKAVSNHIVRSVTYDNFKDAMPEGFSLRHRTRDAIRRYMTWLNGVWHCGFSYQSDMRSGLGVDDG